ncbi:unnamed protein product [Sympodiomycopsis kandeliae]
MTSLEQAAPQTPSIDQTGTYPGDSKSPPTMRSPHALSKKRNRQRRSTVVAALAAAVSGPVPPRSSSLDKGHSMQLLFKVAASQQSLETEIEEDESPYTPSPPPFRSTRTIGARLQRRLSNVFSPSLYSRPSTSSSRNRTQGGIDDGQGISASAPTVWTNPFQGAEPASTLAAGLDTSATVDVMQGQQRRDSVESFRCCGLGVSNIDDVMGQSYGGVVTDDDWSYRQLGLASPLSVSKQPCAPRPGVAELYDEGHGDNNSTSDFSTMSDFFQKSQLQRQDSIQNSLQPGWAARRMNAFTQKETGLIVQHPPRPPRPDTLVFAESLAQMEQDVYAHSPRLASPPLEELADNEMSYESEMASGNTCTWSAPASPVSLCEPPVPTTGYFSSDEPACLRLSLDFALGTIQQRVSIHDDDLPRELFIETHDTVGELKDSLALALERSANFNISRTDLIVSVRTDEVMSPVSPGLRMESGHRNQVPRASSNSPVPSLSLTLQQQQMARSSSVPVASDTPSSVPTSLQLATPQFASTIQHRRRASAAPAGSTSPPSSSPTALGLTVDKPSRQTKVSPPMLTVSTERSSNLPSSSPAFSLSSGGGIGSDRNLSPFTQRWRELKDDGSTIIQDGLQDGDVVTVAVRRRCIYTLF